MFINAIKKAITAIKAEQYTSDSHPGLPQLLDNAMKSLSSFVRKPIDWKRQGTAVVSMWFRQDEDMTPLEAVVQSADQATRIKWAQQVLDAAETLNCDCENLLYDIKLFVNQNNDIVLDVSGCHNPITFHESPERRSNRVAFWLVISPYLPAEDGWRNNFCLQQWLGETLYFILEGNDKIYNNCILNWFYAAQAGAETDNQPTYNQAKNVSPQIDTVLRKLLTLKEGRYSTFEAAIGTAKTALNK